MYLNHLLSFICFFSAPLMSYGFIVLPSTTTFNKSLVIRNKRKIQHFYHVVESLCHPIVVRKCDKHKYGRNIRYMSSLVASIATDHSDMNDTNDNNNPINNEVIEFVTEPMQVYIEDTDAFGVVFNGNYVKLYERVLHNYYYSSIRSSGGKRSNKISNQMLINHVTNHKFKTAARLGDEYVIRGEMVKDIYTGNDGINQQTWELQMIKHYGDSDYNKATNENDVVFNTATITLSNIHMIDTSAEGHSLDKTRTYESDISEPHKSKGKIMTVEASFQTHHDEFSPVLIIDEQNLDDMRQDSLETKYHLPMYVILKYYERIRTIALGGPAALNRTQVEYGVLWVITSIDDFSISHDFMTYQNQILCQEVTVKSKFNLKRGGMIVTCEQEIYSNINGEPTLISKALISMCAIDVKNGYRPTKDIPEFTRELWN